MPGLPVRLDRPARHLPSTCPPEVGKHQHFRELQPCSLSSLLAAASPGQGWEEETEELQTHSSVLGGSLLHHRT